MKNSEIAKSHNLLQWIEIDLGALKQNISNIYRILKPDTKFMAVVKKNAYGCGAVEISHAATEAKVDYLGVNSIEEALELRSASIEAPILILGAVLPATAGKVVKNKLSVTVSNKELAYALNMAGRRINSIVVVHIKIDSGLHRFGLEPSMVSSFIKYLKSLSNIQICGLYTHFSSAGEADNEVTMFQLNRFLKTADQFPRIKIRHAANSAATIQFPNTHLDMVRVGIAIYGIYPSNIISRKVELRPILSLKARIIRIHSVKTGEGVSYGLTWIAPRDSVIALISFGYGHGLPRSLSNRGEILIKSRRAKICGVICMDQSIVDITDIPGVRVGDVITIIGNEGNEKITVEDIAELDNTIVYEILTRLPLSLPRLYFH